MIRKLHEALHIPTDVLIQTLLIKHNEEHFSGNCNSYNCSFNWITILF
jgi:hypothetical protein